MRKSRLVWKINRHILLAIFSIGMALPAFASETPTVQVEPMDATGPCHIAQATQSSVVRDYVEAWQSMAAAFMAGNPAPLDHDFVGIAKEQLQTAIHQQQKLGIITQYKDWAHDLKVTFCSPEGLSVELTDNVDYDLGIQEHDRTLPPQHMRARYVAVLTPTETRWKVRIFRAEPSK